MHKEHHSENYHCIAWLVIVYKIVVNCIKIRLGIYAEKLLGKYQGEFRANLSSVFGTNTEWLGGCRDPKQNAKLWYTERVYYNKPILSKYTYLKMVIEREGKRMHEIETGITKGNRIVGTKYIRQ